MRIGIVFHKNPFAEAAGIDLIRLRALAGGLIRSGIDAEIVSPVQKEGLLEGIIPVRKLNILDLPDCYDLVKTSYHYSIELLGRYRGPVVSRIVRVVDGKFPERDEPFRERLLRCQDMIRARASAVALNNEENRERWLKFYGNRPATVLVPTGCPAEIPPDRGNPYSPGERVILFLGSLAAERMVRMLNQAARRLAEKARFHLVGLNKACMYGGDENCRLDPLIVDHGEIPEERAWDYIRHGDIGIALATGTQPFDNDVSKILNYLRGGIPVLSEEPILNNDLVRATGLGRTFGYGDLEDLVSAAVDLLADPPLERKEAAQRFMIREHSWDRRVGVYADLFRKILDGRHVGYDLKSRPETKETVEPEK